MFRVLDWRRSWPGVLLPEAVSKSIDRGATNLPGVWAAGDVTGRAWLAHAASRMAEVVVHNITGQNGSYAA